MEYFLGSIILLAFLGKLFIWKPKAEFINTGRKEWDGREFDLDDPRIPAPIRTRVICDYRPGCQLFYADTKQGGDWWLLDGSELIGAYWLEK